MTWGSFADSDCYIGSIYHSLEYLPKWYQATALFSVLVLFSLREIAVIGRLAAFLHNSFGTDLVWSEGYQRLLEQMSFNERLCFTLYGIALSLLALAAYRVFARDALHISFQETVTAGGSKWWFVALVCSLFLCEAMVILKEEVTHALSDRTLLAHAAAGDVENATESGFDPHLGHSDSHFVIQLEILKRLLVSFFKRVGPAALLGCCYRLLRDVPRKAHAALRWYIVTLMLSRSLMTLYFMYRNDEWEQRSSWVLFASTLILLGVVNYVFGPSKRGGWTVATSVVASIHQAIQGIVKCTAIFFVLCVFALALVVSVHVVELLLIWLVFFLMTIWVPGIIDSCSTDYMLCIVTAICFVAREMEYLSDAGSFRLWGLVFLWWLDLCLLYNLATNVCRSRYGGVAALFFLFFWAWHTAGPWVRASGFVSFMENCAAALRSVVEEPLPERESVLFKYGANTMFYVRALQTGLGVCVFLMIDIALLNFWEPLEVRSRLRGRSILIVTPKVLFRKLTKTFVLAASIFTCMVTGVFLYRLLPQLAIFAPDFLTLAIAVGFSCTILGALMDVQEFLCLALMRIFGVVEPPAANDDDNITNQNLFFVGTNASLIKS